MVRKMLRKSGVVMPRSMSQYGITRELIQCHIICLIVRSCSVEGASSAVEMLVSLWTFTGFSAAVLQCCLPKFRAIWKNLTIDLVHSRLCKFLQSDVLSDIESPATISVVQCKVSIQNNVIMMYGPHEGHFLLRIHSDTRLIQTYKN